MGGLAGAAEAARNEGGGWRRRDDETPTPTPAGEAGLMKSVCPVKVKINWRSGGGYRDNQPGPVVFKPSPAALPIIFSFGPRSNTLATSKSSSQTARRVTSYRAKTFILFNTVPYLSRE